MKEPNSIKVGFIYYSFYPVTGGASVHGYNLARELSTLGYRLYKLNGDPDPYTRKLTGKFRGFLWMLLNCDLLYVRNNYIVNFRNLTLLAALLLRKKIIVELNSPSDELLLEGYSESYIKVIDKVYSVLLKKVNAVIVVSEPLRRYCTEQLGLEKVYVIPNGGEIFEESELQPDASVKEEIDRLRERFDTLIVWSGSMNKMQDMNLVKKFSGFIDAQTALLFISKFESEFENEFSHLSVYFFHSLDRDSVKYIVKKSDVGLAFYNQYDWCRWGFYNSSLKLYEYINNGLLTLTNISVLPAAAEHENLVVIHTPEEAANMLGKRTKRLGTGTLRTWSDVARETGEIFQKVAG